LTWVSKGQVAVLGQVALKRNLTIWVAKAPLMMRALNRSGAPDPHRVVGGGGPPGQDCRSVAGNEAVLPLEAAPVFHTMMKLPAVVPDASSVFTGGVGVLQVLGPVVLSFARKVPLVTPPPEQPVIDPIMPML
jgi:hypothetical protein